MSKHPASYLAVRKCSFFSPFAVLKVLALSIWRCSLGPNGRWRDTVCTVPSVAREEATESQRIVHETRWVGWTTSFGRVIDISRCNLSGAHRLKDAPPQKKQPRLIIGIICTTCVFDFIRKQPPFSGNVCLFSWHMHSYLIGIAFQRLSICFATKMHLYFLSACNIPNSEPARILSIRVRLDAYINTVMFKAFTFSFLSFVNKGLATTQLLYMTR